MVYWIKCYSGHTSIIQAIPTWNVASKKSYDEVTMMESSSQVDLVQRKDLHLSGDPQIAARLTLLEDSYEKKKIEVVMVWRYQRNP